MLTTRAALIVLGAAIPGSVWVHSQQSSTGRSSDLVILNVTVTDPGGRFVSDLSPADFDVREDGHRQQPTLYMPGTTPLLLSLLVDSSTSMDEDMSDVQQALEKFIYQLRPQDSAELIEFDERPKVLQPSTRDHNLLAAAVKRLRGGGATSLFNALYITLGQLPPFSSGTAVGLRRTAVIVLSDGEDTSSLVSLEALVDVAARSHATIYTIGFHARARGEAVLRQLASQTGGRFFAASRSAHLRRSYAQIAEELASQYLVSYVPSSSEGEWREVTVQVGRPNLEVRTRPGYRRSATRP